MTTMPPPGDTRLTPASSLVLGFDANDLGFDLPTGHAFAHSRASVSSTRDTAGRRIRIGHSMPAWAVRGGVFGVELMPSRQNVLIRSRDLTDAAWIKTNVTVLRDLWGADGQISTGNRLTATSNGGTVAQAVTLASGSRSAGLHLRRVTGTGTIEVSLDGGSTWTAVVPTASWSRFVLPPQTLANPELVIRMGTSGDVIGVDWAQLENGGIPTAPIETAASATTRQPDQVLGTVAQWLPDSGTIAWEVHRAEWMALSGGLGADATLLGLSSVVPKLRVTIPAGSRVWRIELTDAGSTVIAAEVAIPGTGEVLTGGARWRNLATGPEVSISVDGTWGAWSSAAAAISGLGDGVGALGSDADGTNGLATGLCKVKIAPGLLAWDDTLERI